MAGITIMVKKRKRNTNFRLGLNRQELIEASLLFGKKLSTAKKDSTKRLEEYLVNKIGGRGTKIPLFHHYHKRDIRESMKDYGLEHTLALVGFKITKITGKGDENNYLRLTIAREFSSYIEGGVRKEHIDELLSRLPQLNRSELISGIVNHEPYYQQLFMDYVEELQNRSK